MIDRQVTWPEIRDQMMQQLSRTDAALRRAESERVLWMLQGKAQCLEDLLNLPEALRLLDEADEAAEKEKMANG